MVKPLDTYDVVSFEGCELRLATQELFVKGKRGDIEPKVLALLRYLIENRDRAVSKDEELMTL